MNLKKLIASAAICIAASGSAYADVINAGTIPSSSSSPWTDLVIHTGAGTTFTDTLSFTVTETQLSSSANGLALSLGGLTTSTISGLSYTLWSSSGTQIGGTYTGDNTTYTSLLSAAGSYYFLITGTVVGSVGGYAVSLQTSAVPEPATYAMMLAGLGLVGMVARRRKSKA
ncbi:PEPxxWA-CTERM sorting domain-containing protein [Duganella sp. FT80W]|uniref:PEPxxWA-CTERM sorting domain-containing protein n=1 Tax=Duganella guangzhouensis TaxID=2666084 RepID=A0A6I2KTI0_9BURK|nr:FxDxF family PEP-CTERM protein [Duganella guangzhouensis]MRW88610.1 PEPxxWA-CTERM sorting domain-containing protein [Duganella guangzhouensis]